MEHSSNEHLDFDVDFSFDFDFDFENEADPLPVQESVSTTITWPASFDTANAKVDACNDFENSRKRARVACVGCRARKVRCDAAKHGIPCAHCRRDQKLCILSGDKRRRSNGSTRYDYPIARSYCPDKIKESIPDKNFFGKL